MHDLFLKRPLRDAAVIARCGEILDRWAGAIPFSPIKSFTSQTTFVGADEHAVYRVEVVTQEERRRRTNHERPYRGETLPEVWRPATAFDPWDAKFEVFADFAEHRQSVVIVPTRKVYPCKRCASTGRVRCDSCAGRGEVRCGTCSGSGDVDCRSCGGRGSVSRTRFVEKKTSCPVCGGRGRGYSNSSSVCGRCGGRGEVFQTESERYEERCGSCVNGRVRCSRCGGGGRVTCTTCAGKGEVTCSTCSGVGELMSYTTIDRTETPHRKVDVLIPSELPEFKTPANPLSQLEGPGVFTLDERNALDALGLAGEPAGALIEASFRRCRHSVDGRVIRQRLVVTRCVIVSYAYEHAGRRHVIHVNPAHGLVEDLSGPIQQGVDRVMQAARGAFAAGQHEEAFFHVQKLLCMSGSKKEAQALRKAVIGKLAIHYLGWGLSGWGLTSGLLGLFPGTATDAGAPWTWVLGLLPLGLGVWILARDIALGFSRRRARPPLGFLLGVLAAVSCAEDWRFVLPGVLAVFAIVALVRRKERKRRLRIEDRVESFGGVTPLEHYLKNFQKDGPGARTWMLGLGLASVLLLVGQLFLPWDTSSRIRVTLRGERGGRPELDADSRGNHFVVPEIGLEMVPVPAGVFHMGSQSGDDNERPVTEVRISSPYWLGRHEVTQSEWSAIMGASPARWTGGRLPIECVSWEDAMSFCRALTQRERAAGRLPEGFAYTLPTEAQWEHACRAGTDEMYPGNGDADAAGWYESNSDARTHPVGLKRPNRWGLHDMHGNVAEWCLDWYADRLPGGGATDPTGATSGAFRVVRGGGWYGDANYARSTYRGGGDPAARVPLIGFRVALCVSAEG